MGRGPGPRPDATDWPATPSSSPRFEADLPRVMATSTVERVKRIRILATDWLPDSDELTPTSKLKRRAIHAKYAAEIEEMYAGCWSRTRGAARTGRRGLRRHRHRRKGSPSSKRPAPTPRTQRTA